MGSVRRRELLAATLVLALAAGGCAVPEEPAVTLRAGYDSLDGPLQVWPARGRLATDSRAGAQVAAAVDRWRSPVDDRVHLPSSGMLWLGEADGAPLALVAADVPGDRGSWLLQLTGDDRGFRVSRAVEYPDPGYLVYSDVLPVQLPTGRRYLTSARVEELRGADGVPLAVTDGLSAPVAVPGCSAVPVTARLRATESQPAGRPADRLLDLGTEVTDPRYPLVRDETGTGVKALAELDTCTLATRDGPFGSIPRRVHDRDDPALMPLSWPMERITTRSLGEVTLAGTGTARLDQLSWRTDAGMMTSMVLRPEQGVPVAATADRPTPLQAYLFTINGRTLVALSWRAGADTALSLPADLTRLVDRPGVVIVENPAVRQTVGLASGEKTPYRSIGGDNYLPDRHRGRTWHGAAPLVCPVLSPSSGHPDAGRSAPASRSRPPRPWR